MILRGKEMRLSYICWVILLKTLLAAVFTTQGQNLESAKALDIQGDPQVMDSIYYERFRAIFINGGDKEEARKYALAANRLSRQYGHHQLYARSCRGLAIFYNSLGLADSARYFLYAGLETALRHNLDQLVVYTTNDLGVYFESHDVYDSALKYYNISLETATRLGMEEDVSFALNNIGLVFYYLSNYDEALENMEASVALKRKNNLPSLHVSLMNIGLIYNDQKRYDEALSLLSEVEKTYLDDCTDRQLADLYFILGYAHFHKASFAEAMAYFDLAYKHGQASGNRKVVANVLHHFGIYNLEQNKLDESRQQLEQALALAAELRLRRTKRDIYGTMQQLYSEMGNVRKTLEFQTRYMELKDSIFNEQMANNLKEIQLSAQKRYSEGVIRQKDMELKRVRLIILLVGVIAVLVLIVSLLVYRNYRISHRMKILLEEEVKKRTQELVETNTELTRMNTEYDHLVYRASHDIRGPLATLLGLTRLAKQDYNDPNRVIDYLTKIHATANGLIETLSQLMETNRIRNMPLNIEAIDVQDMADKVLRSFKSLNHFPLISLRTEKGDWQEPLVTDQELVEFVLTRLLDNAFRYFDIHKEERYIKVSWSQEGGQTTLAVEDNGQGIDMEAREKIFQMFYVASDAHGHGLGLFLSQLAANRLGGRIVLARSENPTIFKLVIASRLAEEKPEVRPLMTVVR